MRVLKGAVVVEIAKAEVVGNRVKRMLFQIIVAIARKGDRIDKGSAQREYCILRLRGG